MGRRAVGARHAMMRRVTVRGSFEMKEREQDDRPGDKGMGTCCPQWRARNPVGR
jgi:hypothetical protein